MKFVGKIGYVSLGMFLADMLGNGVSWTAVVGIIVSVGLVCIPKLFDACGVRTEGEEE